MTGEDHLLLSKVLQRDLFGLDFEWKTGKKSKISMIQIAIKLSSTEYFCVLLRIKPNSALPLYIHQFLTLKTKRKIICSRLTSTASDAVKLLKSFNIRMSKATGYVSIQDLANSRNLPIGFDSLAEHFKLPSNKIHHRYYMLWEDEWDPDTARVLETYAAVDAIHTHILHEKLLEIRMLGVYPCREMIRNGECSRENCEYSHAITTCDTCNVMTTSQDAWKLHLAGRKHRESLKHNSALPKSEFECKDCDRGFVSRSALEYHFSSREHAKIQNVKAFQKSKSLSQADKDGFGVISGDVDFGVVEKIGIEKTVVVEVENNTDNNAKITCSYPKKEGDCVELIVMSSSLPAQGHAIVTIAAAAKRLGYFQSELTFNIVSGRKTVKISRTVSVFVGDKDLFEDLKPKTPYVRKKLIPAINGQVIRSGIKTIFETGISPKFVKKLGKFDVDPRIRKLCTLPINALKAPHHLMFSDEFFPKNFSDPKSYATFFSSLLAAEECQMEIDIREYTLIDTKLAVSGGRKPVYTLVVPGLAEARPSVLRGDSVIVKAQGQPPYEGKCINVESNSVQLQFHGEFDRRYVNGTSFNVQFNYNRIPWRRMQEAVSIDNQVLAKWDGVYRSEVSLEKSKKVEAIFETVKKINWKPFNRLIASNEEQKLAVSLIVSGAHHPFPFLLFGPPGTGKTITIVEAIKQIVLDSKSRVLVCAPSNSAADLLLERLSPLLKPSNMFRLNAASRGQPSHFKDFEKFCFIQQGVYGVPPLEQLLKFKVVVSTCCSSAILASVGVPSGHFTHVFLDEAGQALEPEAVIPLNSFKHPESTKFILAGDHKQLGPIIHSGIAQKLGLGISLLERLMAYCKWSSPTYKYSIFKQHNPNRSSRDFEMYNSGTSLYSIKLLNNYRSHPDILHVPNELFYQSELEPCADEFVINRFLSWEGLMNKKSPILFIHTVGKDMREGNSPSFFNITEVQQTMQVVESLRSLPGISGDMIGVISPYNKQCETLRKNLKKYGVNSVGNVETFQGQERDVIIISTVRSNPDYLAHDSRFNLGFVGDPKRFNVSVTRAKGLCIVIGNGEILCRDKSWQAWIRHAFEMNAVRGCTRELAEAINADLPEVENDDEEDEEERDLARNETGWREIE